MAVLDKLHQAAEGEIDNVNDVNDRAAVGDSVPTSTRMCVFQLSESNDLERIANILTHLNDHKCTSNSQLLYLT